MAGKQADWRRYAAPTAFLVVATIAIVLVTSALHHATGRTATTTAAASKPTRAPTRTVKTTTVGKRRFYTVVAGDTFGVIASKTGTSVAAIERLNPGASSTSLHIGQKLRIA